MIGGLFDSPALGDLRLDCAQLLPQSGRLVGQLPDSLVWISHLRLRQWGLKGMCEAALRRNSYAEVVPAKVLELGRARVDFTLDHHPSG